MFSSYNRDIHKAITDSITIDYKDLTNLHNIINEYGVCIVRDVLDEDECKSIRDGMCNDFSHLTSRMPVPFDIRNTATWSTLDSLLPTDGLIYQHWGIGQSQTVWNVRTNDKVIDVFRQIYRSADLLVSFDAVSFHLPPEIADMKSNRFYTHDRWHFDQSLTRKNPECIQSWINAFDTSYDDATTCIMIYSNRLHGSYADYILSTGVKLETDDWYRIDDVSFFTSQRCIPYRVEASKGSLVLWDSRTLHFGSKPLPSRTIPNYRMLIYLCYTPASLITESTRKRKVEIMYKKGKQGEHRMTNHWPHKPKLFPETPRLWNNAAPLINPLPTPTIGPDKVYLLGIR